jgi:hypothetical protein
VGHAVARYDSIRRTVLTAAVLAVAAPAVAQPLADAARRAEEQRKASTVEPLVLKQPARPDGPVRLTPELVNEYLAARIALADVRRADRALDVRLDKAMRARVMTYYANYLPLLEAEAAISDTLAGFGFTPASYLFIEQALMRGLTVATSQGRAVVAPAHAENVRFVVEHLEFVRTTLNRGLQAERKLQSCCVVLIPD